MTSLNTKPLVDRRRLLDWFKPDKRELARHMTRKRPAVWARTCWPGGSFKMLPHRKTDG